MISNYVVALLNTVIYSISSTLDTRAISVAGYIIRRLVVTSVIKLVYLFLIIMLLATAEAECGTF
jgi:hypothetical protein